MTRNRVKAGVRRRRRSRLRHATATAERRQDNRSRGRAWDALVAFCALGFRYRDAPPLRRDVLLVEAALVATGHPYHPGPEDARCT